jgi:hypothetical protein
LGDGEGMLERDLGGMMCPVAQAIRGSLVPVSPKAKIGRKDLFVVELSGIHSSWRLTRSALTPFHISISHHILLSLLLPSNQHQSNSSKTPTSFFPFPFYHFIANPLAPSIHQAT